jgi:RNA-binding protein YhbY
MPIMGNIQLGKQGITENFIGTLKTYFKKHKNVKVSVLKNAGRDKIKDYAEEMKTKLGKNYSARIIGFTINLRISGREIKED